MKVKIVLFLFAVTSAMGVSAQDSLRVGCSGEPVSETWASDSTGLYKPDVWRLLTASTLVGVGIVGLESQWLIYQNHEIRDELQESIDHRLSIDDISQYAPAAAVYGLGLCGVRGRHDAMEQTIIMGMAYALMGISVSTIKHTSSVERPDGSALNSFPSGHTATAFVGAEMLRREYWHVSPWIGVAGYAVATGTGFFRMYNNRHWLTDVLAGAGIGILSVEMAYWLYPTVSKALFPKRSSKRLVLSPYVSPEEKGLALSLVF
ncbi:MAG: phosphatase PAP2 family protein [Prevotella sp.]